MTFGERAKSLRRELGLSQEALGAQGFISTPGWIKIENGQRQPSEKLIGALVDWLVREKHIRAGAAKTLQNELLVLKHLGGTSPFLRGIVQAYARENHLAHLLVASTAPKPPRGRPKLAAASR